jgi:hypothetical protein
MSITDASSTIAHLIELLHQLLGHNDVWARSPFAIISAPPKKAHCDLGWFGVRISSFQHCQTQKTQRPVEAELQHGKYGCGDRLR